MLLGNACWPTRLPADDAAPAVPANCVPALTRVPRALVVQLRIADHQLQVRLELAGAAVPPLNRLSCRDGRGIRQTLPV